jgi:stage 0 sporulation regulatory protein
LYKYSNSRSEMLAEIKLKREIMIQCANKYGLTNEKTIECSQELDELINDYQKSYGQASKSGGDAKLVFNKMIMVWPRALIEL